MKKQFKIHQDHPNLISVDLIERGKTIFSGPATIGGYIIPNKGDAVKFIIEHLEKEGYINYEKANHSKTDRKEGE